MTSITLSVASAEANAITNLTMVVLLSVGVNSTDVLYFTVPQHIVVFNCSVVSCSVCTCGVTNANPNQGILVTTIKVTNFPVVASGSSGFEKEVRLVVGVKNPINSGYSVGGLAVDGENYTKETGSGAYPSISQSTISSSVFVFSSSSNMVYHNTNFTMVLNLSGYSLIDGWMLINFDSAITMPDTSNPYCLVNGNNGLCVITIANSIRANITIDKDVLVYTININGLRNPQSTQYYAFVVTLTDPNATVYYTLTSSNYQAS